MPEDPDFDELELRPEDLGPRYDLSVLDFESTADLEPLEGVIGQDRAVQAIDFGTSIESFGYNLFVTGRPGSGRTTTVTDIVRRKAAEEPAPSDWCYVYNFEDANAPQALEFPAGMGPRFRRDMEELVKELGRRLERAFEGEAYSRERKQLTDQLQEAQREEFSKLEELARNHNFTVQQVGQMFGIVPMVNDEPLTPEKYEELDEEEKKRIDQQGQELREAMTEAMRRLQALEKEIKNELRELDRRIGMLAIGDLFEALRRNYEQQENVVKYLKRVQEDVLAHLQEFLKGDEQEGRPPQLMGIPLPRAPGPWDRYQLNLLVTNKPEDGAPVVVEDNPAYYNLVGRIEHRAQFGALTTDFTLIKPGAFHRANGGYLIMSARDVLLGFMAWDALKRMLRSQSIKIEDMNQQYRLVSTVSLEPEAIPADIRVVLIGTPLLYALLYHYDEDFRKLFKVQVDFDDRIDAEQTNLMNYARFVATRVREEGLLDFDRRGVAEVARLGARLVEDQRKLASTFSEIADIVREASYWGRRNGGRLVSAEDVRRAVEAKEHRANRLEERLRELIEEDTIMIATEGKAVGQVNGIAILMWGDYTFGKPSRITARTFAGRGGVVNIEREVKLGGRIHNKGVMILTGYLGGRYAQDRPLTLNASLGFEQSYEEIEGDSASSAELYALLSSIAEVPLRQDLAVTGSVNQHGEIQPVGGVTRKVEGFYDVCRTKGLTGSQGVIVPRRNLQNLVLRKDVIEAVAEGKFHLYGVNRVEEGMSLLAGMPMGERQSDGSYPEGTVNARVLEGLDRLAEAWKQFGGETQPPQKPREEGDEAPESPDVRV